MTTTAQSKRRFVHFSLRTLLLLVVVIGVTLGWTLHEVREQGRAVAALEEVGCHCTIVDHLTLNSPTTLEILRGLLSHDESRNVDAVTCGMSQVTDEGLVHLQQMRYVTWLDLSNTRVTDDGLDYIARLTQLDSLVLQEAMVTDAGMMHLQRLTKLEQLSLQKTDVTDVGLVFLHGLSQLIHINLIGTQVSSTGVERLQKALPTCIIFWDGDSGRRQESHEPALPRLELK